MNTMIAKLREAIDLADRVGQSRRSNCFAMNERATKRLVDVQMDMEAALSAQDQLFVDVARWRKCTSLARKVEEFGTLEAHEEFCHGLWKRFDAAIAAATEGARPVAPQANLTASIRTLLERVYERLCKAQIFGLAGDVRTALEASAAATSAGLPLNQEPKFTVDGDSIVNRASRQRIPADEPVFIMRARDRFAAGAIYNYALDCPPGSHRAAVLKRFDDFCSFAKQHPERMKTPDTTAA